MESEKSNQLIYISHNMPLLSITPSSRFILCIMSLFTYNLRKLYLILFEYILTFILNHIFLFSFNDK